MRRFVVIGQAATASGEFLFDDLPGTSGRIDVLLRCLRAALLVSHGLRRDAIAYLVLMGGPRAPRAIRVVGEHVRFLRPDERSLAVLANKLLSKELPEDARGFVELKAGLAVADGGLDVVLADLGDARPFVLDGAGVDVRDAGDVGAPSAVFFVGDHLGFDEATRAKLVSIGARALSIGPTVVHAEDAVAVLSNELDRREHAARARS
jgi:tRNA (pseudouridine54-N1)-methyltransferase